LLFVQLLCVPEIVNGFSPCSTNHAVNTIQVFSLANCECDRSTTTAMMMLQAGQNLFIADDGGEEEGNVRWRVAAAYSIHFCQRNKICAIFSFTSI